MKQKFFVSLVVVLFAFFIDGLFSFINDPKLEKELQDQIAVLIDDKIAGQLNSERVLGDSSAITVTRVVDADTIELDTGAKVRYIGIDTPETKHPTKEVECYGVIASEKNKQLVEGKEVRLEKDVSQADRYGRLLRYVYVLGNDGVTEIFVNEYLVREGFALASSYPPDVKHQDLFSSAQELARQQNKGLWGEDCFN